jgi:N,N'-diacetyllegionaminate synthase
VAQLDLDRLVVIGEIAQAHDGSLGFAHAFVDAVADAGADAVKFQTHIAAAESRRDEPWRVRFSYEDETRYEYWQRMELGEEQWAGLARHAADRGLLFLSSAFSLEAVELLERVGVAAWKVASGEVSNTVLLRRMAATGTPVLLSSGMSPWAELDAGVAVVRDAGAPLAVLQCTSSYPVVAADLGLNVLGELRDRYDCPVGLSDHSGTIYPSIAAAALGATAIEVHVTMSRHMFGPDVPASVTVEELGQLVAGVRYVAEAVASPVDKDAMAQRMAPMHDLFTRSVVAGRDLPAGTVLAAADLTLKKPGDGLPPARLDELVGQRLRRDVKADERLAEEDVVPLGADER